MRARGRRRLLAALAAAVLGLTAGCREAAPPAPVPEGLPRGAALQVPPSGAYAGAYVEFGDTEDRVTLESIEGFEALTGRRLAIVASSSFWGEGAFPARGLEIIARHGAVPLVFWSPWDRPYEQQHGPDRFRLERILAGEWDAYIDAWADAARVFDRPLLVSWGLEMNGEWFPWSGAYYNAAAGAPAAAADPHPGPRLYVQAYRHVVDRVRARGAARIQWVFHANHFSFPDADWNRMARYWPGADYVDWLGLSVYGMQFREARWTGFREVMAGPYAELCRLDPEKPVIVAEWGVGEFPAAGSKADFIREALTGMQADTPRVKAAVFWHERWQNPDETYSNLRVNSSPEALAAFRQGIAAPFWRDRPLLVPAPRP